MFILFDTLLSLNFHCLHPHTNRLIEAVAVFFFKLDICVPDTIHAY